MSRFCFRVLFACKPINSHNMSLYESHRKTAEDLPETEVQRSFIRIQLHVLGLNFRILGPFNVI